MQCGNYKVIPEPFNLAMVFRPIADRHLGSAQRGDASFE
jgi:hypothetical protein